MALPVPLRLAWREARGSLPHFRFFLVCIALGVGSLVAVGNFSANLSDETLREARNLLGADIEIRLPHPSPGDEQRIFAAMSEKGVKVLRVTELLAMAAPPGGASSQLVELKAVDPGYPFYGRLEQEPPGDIEIGADPSGVLAQEGLYLRLDLKVGEKIRLGEGTFDLRGILRKEPDRVAGPFSLGPRILISQEALRQSRLVRPGSRVRHRYLLKIPPDLPLKDVQEFVGKLLKGEGAEVRSFRDVQPQMKRSLESLMRYIRLVALITMLIGGIGVAESVRSYLSGNMDHIAILKSLGASSTDLLFAYLAQVLSLAILGSGLGIAFGIGLQALLQREVRDLLSVGLPLIGGGATLLVEASRATATGLLTAVLFALPPLISLRSVSAGRLLRRNVEPAAFLPSWGTRLAVIGTGIGCFGLIGWQSGSLRIALWAAGALLLCAATFSGLTFLLFFLLRRCGVRRGSLRLRQGVANLHRPGNQTLPVVVSLGLGVTALVTLSLVEGSMMDHLRGNIPTDAPSLFFIDIQPDQKTPFEKLMQGWALRTPPRLTPLVRSRLDRIDGRKTSELKGDRPDQWYFTREYVLTEQAEVPDHNRIIEGSWWKPEGAEGSVSAEQEAARHLGIRLGSELTFDVEGVPLIGTVRSIREVDWGSFTTNFFMIFSPRSLAGAPMTYVAEVETPRAEDLAVQTAVVRAFPNVTAISLRDLLDGIARLLEKIALVIRWLAALVLACGLVVLSGSLAATRFRRMREMAILKSLGATRPDLLRTLSAEYLVLGLISGTAGSALSIPLAYGVVRFLLESPWSFHPARILAGIGAATGLTVLTGLLGSYKTIGQKPLVVLRTE